MVRAVLVIGGKKTGKTTVVELVARELKARGFTVGTVKHMYHGKIDVEGKDTYRHGLYADAVGAVAPGEHAVIFKRPGTLHDVARLMDVDVLLIEGFKDSGVAPKIVCGRTVADAKALFDGLEMCVSGLVSNRQVGEICSVPVLNPFKEVAKIADLVLRHGFLLPGLDCGGCGFAACREMARQILAGVKSPEDCAAYVGEVKVYIDGGQLPLKPFVARLIGSVVKSMVSQLKGGRPKSRIVIEVKVSEAV